MTDESTPTESKLKEPNLDAEAIFSQAAALAQHLQRSGVQWLPKANQDEVEAISEQFAGAVVASAVVQTSTASAVGQLPGAVRPDHAATTQRAAPLLQDPVVEATDRGYSGEALASDQRQSALDSVNEQVRGCARCEILAGCRKHTVFGEGSPSARFVFFGEGPGADEDRTGRPFVGRAGQLLTKMIEACTLRRDDVYIMNTVKCRPPGNRNPEPEEIQNCREYYQRQFEILRPEYIVCLGAVSAQELLQSKASVGKMRGRFHRYFESKVLVTYHPAYLLRTPAAKKAAWDDLQLMMRDAGLVLP